MQSDGGGAPGQSLPAEGDGLLVFDVFQIAHEARDRSVVASVATQVKMIKAAKHRDNFMRNRSDEVVVVQDKSCQIC